MEHNVTSSVLLVSQYSVGKLTNECSSGLGKQSCISIMCNLAIWEEEMFFADNFEDCNAFCLSVKAVNFWLWLVLIFVSHRLCFEGC